MAPVVSGVQPYSLFLELREKEREDVSRLESDLIQRGYRVTRDIAAEGFRFDLGASTEDGRQVLIDVLVLQHPRMLRARRRDYIARAFMVQATTRAHVLFAVASLDAGVAFELALPFVPLAGIVSAIEGAVATASPVRKGVITAGAPEIFVAMPFAPEFSDVFNVGIRSAAKSVRASVFRVDYSGNWTDIVQDIRTHIEGCALVVADLSLARPNVLYEVGYAQALGKTTILLADASPTTAPFDVAHQKIHEYALHNTMALQ